MNRRILKLYSWIIIKRGLWLRLLLCWITGVLVLTTDEFAGHDQRFQMRGDLKVNNEIVIITLKPSDFSRLLDRRTHSLISLNEISDFTDSFYWDTDLWERLLQILIKQKPKAIGVGLYFGDNIAPLQISAASKTTFLNPQIFWSATTNSLDRVLVPIFTNTKGTNLGSNEIKKDEDGVVRRIYNQTGDLPHLAERISNKKFPETKGPLIINFRGAKVFQNYSLSEILNEELPQGTLTNKIILIGAETSSASEFLTPLGTMNRVEVLAHLVDNLENERWVKHWPLAVYAVFLFVITLVAVLIITAYPQGVAIVFYFALGLLIAALSAWCFDTHSLWLPTVSVFFTLGTVWFIFVGYQASRIEKKHFLLQQEQKNRLELEQLKNNFVSLISHDLKTPIAKIQAIVGRLQRESKTIGLEEELFRLQEYSEELNRYIQSVLRLLRVESSEFRLHKEAMDPNEVIEEAIRFLKPLAEQKNIEIQTDLEPLFTLEFDVTLIKEVVMNLIENAIKYSSSNQKIMIHSAEDSDGVHISVQDFGEGIAPEDLPHIWGKFVRGRDQDMKTKGSGLGLYLVKYFIELHGGQVSLKSIYREGTTVSFTLPFEQIESPSDQIKT